MSFRLWRNWAGNLEADAHVASPGTLEELQRVVREAAKPREDGAPGRLRVAGGSYSWAPLIPHDGTIIEMHRFDRLLEIDVEAMTVEVECGMTIEQLTQHAERFELALITPTLFPRPTIGGVVATGCHGTSRLHGNFSDNVLSMRIIKHDGEVAVLERGDPDFAAAQVALGTFGVLYSVKLRLQPQFNVRVETRKWPVEEVLSGLDDLRATNDSVEIFWWPFQKTMYVYTMNRTESWPDEQTLFSRLFQKTKTFLENAMAGGLLPWIAAKMPNFTPILSWLSDKVTSQVGVKVQTAEDAFHFQKAYPKCWDMSYAFPAEQASQAWATGIELVNRYAEAGLYPLNLALHGRFTGASEGLLAPDHARETGYVEAVTVKGTPHWQSFFEELEDRWLEIEGARPHWCKVYFQTVRVAERYPELPAFHEARARWDPDGVFLNEFVADMLRVDEAGTGPRVGAESNERASARSADAAADRSIPVAPPSSS